MRLVLGEVVILFLLTICCLLVERLPSELQDSLFFEDKSRSPLISSLFLS